MTYTAVTLFSCSLGINITPSWLPINGSMFADCFTSCQCAQAPFHCTYNVTPALTYPLKNHNQTCTKTWTVMANAFKLVAGFWNNSTITIKSEMDNTGQDEMEWDWRNSISSSFLYFDICNYICLDTSYHFCWLYLYFLNILYLFKYSCTNIFYRRSLCTLYWMICSCANGRAK